jgi:HEAT repeat protein
MPSRGHVKPRRGIQRKFAQQAGPQRGSRVGVPAWGPSASERKLADPVTKTNPTVTVVLAGLFCSCVFPPPALASAQVPFEQALADLASPDTATRLRTAKMLKDAAYPESAAPLAKLIVDPQDSVQLEAIAAELNIFIAEKIVPRKRVGFIVELRTPVAADAIFSTGPLAVGPRPVPGEVLDALRTAARDDNPRVRLEALYAFGVLAVQPGGDVRRALLRASGPDLAAMIGAVDPSHRYAALQVIGRLFERRPHDEPIDQNVGDAVISALNEKEPALQAAAMQALGAMRYERAVQGLMDLFQYHSKGAIAESALDAIAHIAHPSSVSLLVAQLASKNAVLKGTAIEGLARAGDRIRLGDVQSAIRTDRNGSVQLAGSLASVTLSESGGGDMAPIVEALANPRLREQARWYLIEVAPGRTQAFTRFVQDPDPFVRTALVDALGLSGEGAAIALVQPMASDKDVQVARAVERALARLRQ